VNWLNTATKHPGVTNLKILRVIASVNPTNGGPIEGVLQSSRSLSQRGHDVEVVSLDLPEAPWVESFPLKLHALGPTQWNYRYCPKLVPWLKRNQSNYDVALIHGIWQYSSYGAWQALRGGDLPYFLLPHGMLDPWFKHTYPLKHLKKSLYWQLAERHVVRDAKALLFTSEEERRLARKSFRPYKCEEAVINYGTRGPGAELGDFKRRFLARHPELEGKRLLLFLGRLHPKKGCDLLLQGFSRVLAQEPSYHLVMAGPDQEGWMSELQSLAVSLGIHDRVHWTGMLEGDLKWEAMAAADAFVLPSHQENFGIAVAEALACGLPVLISNKVNIWREIVQAGAGLVAEDSEAGVCDLLRDWLQLSELERDTMRERAVQCFKAHFEIEDVAQSFLDVFSRFGVSSSPCLY
jgi:glycosyltransferase involved in cell wall biosynthesis